MKTVKTIQVTHKNGAKKFCQNRCGKKLRENNSGDSEERRRNSVKIDVAKNYVKTIQVTQKNCGEILSNRCGNKYVKTIQVTQTNCGKFCLYFTKSDGCHL